jgi:hypothetical protein
MPKDEMVMKYGFGVNTDIYYPIYQAIPKQDTFSKLNIFGTDSYTFQALCLLQIPHALAIKSAFSSP